MHSLRTRLCMVVVTVAALTVVNCGSKSSTASGPVLTTYGKDSLAVRNILDANALQSVEVGGALSPLDNQGERIGELNLQGKNLTVIPKDIGQLAALTALRLDSNAITSLPAELGNCTSLKLLSITKNKLTGLPVEIGKLKSLTNLNVSQNTIASLPSSIGGLQKLSTIRLDNNQLASLPDSIMQCPIGEIGRAHV
jgi:Leucine-rich repeat (LRR) protein